jgi:peptidoglycan-associated lipoprotein
LKNSKSFLFILLIISVAFTLTACHKHHAEIEPPTSGTTAPSTMGEAPPSTPQQTTEGPMTTDLADEVSKQMQPVFFDYNHYDIREDQIPALQNNARVLKQNATVSLLIEGHCDERGTEEYNLALGERRAGAAKDFLVSLGIPDSRLSTISYGESRPFAQGHDEQSWSQNRRAQFVAVRK